jgi:hypothetical protein
VVLACLRYGVNQGSDSINIQFAAGYEAIVDMGFFNAANKQRMTPFIFDKHPGLKLRLG